MTEQDRLRNIARLWPRHRWDGEGRSRWAQWGWRHYISILVLVLLISVAMVEKALSDNGEKQPWPFFGWLAESPAGLALLALLMFLNGWLIDHALAERTPFENHLPFWVRYLRRAAATLPILGLYVIPCWRWVIQRRPAWSLRSAATRRLDLSSPPAKLGRMPSPFRARIDSLRRNQNRSLSALLLWLIAGQTAPWIALLSWMTTADSLSPGRRTALDGLSVLFRVLACAVAVQYGILRGRQIRAKRMRLFVLRFAPCLFLLPSPFFIAGLLPWIAAIGEEEETLISRSWRNKSQASLQVIGARGSSPFSAFSTAGENSDAMDARFAFHRLKILLLFLDAGALAWVLTRSGRPLFSFSSFPLRQIAPYLLLATLGLMAEGIMLVKRLLGWIRREHLSYAFYGRAITFTQLTLAGGLLFGSLLAWNEVATAGHLLIVIGLSAVILSALIFSPLNFLLIRPGRQIYVTLSWVFLFFEIVLVGCVMYGRLRFAPWFVDLFKVALGLSPLWSLALFFGLGGWLLHPFRLRHLFDRRLPGSARAVLATVALTAALPFGGLAIPFWIYAQNRLWPRYEPLLREGTG